MPIRFVDKVQPARVGLINSTLDGASADIDGTHTAPAARTGTIGAMLQPHTAALSGNFQSNANRVGTIASTLAGHSAAFTGTHTQAASANNSLQFFGNVSDGLGRVTILANTASIPANAALVNDFTLDFWLRPASSGNNEAAISPGNHIGWINGNIFFDRDRLSTNRSWGMSLGAGRPNFGLRDSGNSEITVVSSGADLRDNQWHHIRLQRTRSTGAIQMWVDGSRVVNQASGPTGDISHPGGSGAPADRFWTWAAEKHDITSGDYAGYITEVFIRPGLASSNTATITVPSSRFTAVTGSALYHCDEASGTDLIDANSNQSPGLLQVGSTGNGPVRSTSSPFSSSALTQGQTFTITGSGFGSKTTAAPLVYDSCSHGQSVATRWNTAGGGLPNGSGSAANLNYRAVTHRSIGGPHSSATHFLCGLHALNGTGTGSWANNVGPNVMFGRNRTYANGDVSYYSFYTRVDPAWIDGVPPPGDPNDINHKIFEAGPGGSGFYEGSYFYLEYREPGMDVSEPVLELHSNDLDSPDLYGNSIGSSKGEVDNPVTGWKKHEIFIRWSTGTDGYIYYVSENENSAPWPGSATRPNTIALGSLHHNKCCHWYRGQTLNFGTGSGHESLGGFSRDTFTSGALNNWRYWSDIYLDTTFTRVVLANSATYESATITEVQPATSWSANEITATCRKGRLSSGTVHVFVFDSANNRTYVGTRTMT